MEFADGPADLSLKNRNAQSTDIVMVHEGRDEWEARGRGMTQNLSVD